MKDRAFTLIELIIVIVIIGILTSLAVPNYIKKAEQARDQEAKTVLKLIAAAEKIYYLKHNDYYMTDPNNPSVAELNSNLNIDLPINNANWTYLVFKVMGALCAQATRNNPPAGFSRNWTYMPALDQFLCSGSGCSAP